MTDYSCSLNSSKDLNRSSPKQTTYTAAYQFSCFSEYTKSNKQKLFFTNLSDKLLFQQAAAVLNMATAYAK
jgi:hypothetical protein